MRQYTDTTSVNLFLSDAYGASVLSIGNSYSVALGISPWIDKMTKYIEEETGRQFIADTSTSVKLYELDYEDSGEIGRYDVVPSSVNIDEAVDVTKLEVKGSLTDSFVEVSSDKVLEYPANKVPKTRLYVDSGASTQLKIGHQNIRVTAKWGYSVDCPEDIKFACTVLVAGVLQYAHRHQGQQTSLSMGRYQVSFRTDKQLGSFNQAKEIIDRYKKRSIT